MGLDKSIYIGPYIRIRSPQKTVERTGIVPCCGRNPVGKFCVDCGKAAEYKSAQVLVDAVSQGDLAQEINEALCYFHDMAGEGEDGFHYWRPNGAPMAWKLPDADTVGAQELTEKAMRNAVLDFGNRYLKEIDTLVRAYNATAEFQFGVLVWWS